MSCYIYRIEMGNDIQGSCFDGKHFAATSEGVA